VILKKSSANWTLVISKLTRSRPQTINPGTRSLMSAVAAVAVAVVVVVVVVVAVVVSDVVVNAVSPAHDAVVFEERV
jgi:hypothetical protein